MDNDMFKPVDKIIIDGVEIPGSVLLPLNKFGEPVNLRHGKIEVTLLVKDSFTIVYKDDPAFARDKED